MKKEIKGFTLIELLVVIGIIAILVGLSIFGLEGARRSSRDARRKADLELLRSGLEIYKSDCNAYPLANPPNDPLTVFGSALMGSGDPVSCSASNVYISQVPKDPTSPASGYLYYSDGSTYQICAALEQVPAGTPAVSCGGSSACGGTNGCNYKVINP